jgi:hypothetical protein
VAGTAALASAEVASSAKTAEDPIIMSTQEDPVIVERKTKNAENLKKARDAKKTKSESSSQENNIGRLDYVQNSEQSEKTLWQRIQDKKK